MKEKIDKKDYRQLGVRDRGRGVVKYDNEPLTLEFAPKAIVDILDWMAKTTKSKKTPGNKYFVNLANGQKSTLSTQLTQLLDNYFKYGSRENLMPLNEKQSISFNALRDIFEKNDSNFTIRDIASDIYIQLLNKSVVF